jgi:hypothetical protein
MSRAERRAMVERVNPVLPVPQQCRLLAVCVSALERSGELLQYYCGVGQSHPSARDHLSCLHPPVLVYDCCSRRA